MEYEPFGYLEEFDGKYILDNIEYGLNLWFVFSLLYSLFYACLMNYDCFVSGFLSMLLSMSCIFSYQTYLNQMYLNKTYLNQ